MPGGEKERGRVLTIYRPPPIALAGLGTERPAIRATRQQSVIRNSVSDLLLRSIFSGRGIVIKAMTLAIQSFCWKKGRGEMMTQRKLESSKQIRSGNVDNTSDEMLRCL